MPPVTAVKAIKLYFESDPHGRPVSMQELKELSATERHELGQLAAAELGLELVSPSGQPEPVNAQSGADA